MSAGQESRRSAGARQAVRRPCPQPDGSGQRCCGLRTRPGRLGAPPGTELRHRAPAGGRGPGTAAGRRSGRRGGAAGPAERSGTRAGPTPRCRHRPGARGCRGVPRPARPERPRTAPAFRVAPVMNRPDPRVPEPPRPGFGSPRPPAGPEPELEPEPRPGRGAARLCSPALSAIRGAAPCPRPPSPDRPGSAARRKGPAYRRRSAGPRSARAEPCLRAALRSFPPSRPGRTAGSAAGSAAA